MKQPIQSVIRFMRREVVLTAAVLLALLSSVFVGPANLDLSYIDWNTLALLFGLMAVMKGFQKAGMFLSLGSRLLEVTASTRSMLAVLVFLPFVCSMVITNGRFADHLRALRNRGAKDRRARKSLWFLWRSCRRPPQIWAACLRLWGIRRICIFMGNPAWDFWSCAGSSSRMCWLPGWRSFF